MTIDTDKSIGARIRALRKKKEWTQEQLAKKVGLTKGGISHIERGLHSPGTETLRKIAAEFSISAALLAEPDVDPKKLVEISLVLEKAKHLSDHNLRLLLTLAESLQDA